MNVAVVGGAGRMGQWIAQYFSVGGHRVIISDSNLEKARAVAGTTGVELAKTNLEAVENADLVMVSTPIQVTPKLIHEITPHVRRGAIVAEISSLKEGAVKALINVSKFDIQPLSIHPLFGPGAKKLKDRKIAVVPILDSKLEERLTKKLFPGVEITVIDVEDHDRAMALILSLPHFVNMAFASVIGDENIEMLKRLEGPTFKLQLTLAESVLTEDPSLQASIQMNNKHTSRYLNKFLSRAKTLEEWIEAGEEEKIILFYNRLQAILSQNTDFLRSYERIYDVLERL